MGLNKTKLFLVAIDGEYPWNWRPFNRLKLAEISHHFKEDAKNFYNEREFEISFVTSKIDDLNDEILSKTIGCIIDANSYDKNNLSVKISKLAQKLKKIMQSSNVDRMYVIANKSVKDDQDGYFAGIKEKFEAHGHNVDIHGLSEEDEIAHSMNFIATNISLNGNLDISGD